MKKIVVCTILVIAVLFSCAIPAFAAESGEWILSKGAGYIQRGDKTYKPVEYYCVEGTYKFIGENPDVEELEFLDAATRERYWGAYIECTPSSEDHVVSCYMRTAAGIYSEWTNVLYVEESYLETYSQVKDGNTNSYVAENGPGVQLKFGADVYNSFKNGAALSSYRMDDDFIKNCSKMDMYAVDDATTFAYVSGEFLYDNVSEKFYVLPYSEYDSSYFNSDGTFKFQSSKEYKLYEIVDDTFKAELNELLDAVPEDMDYYWTLGRNASYIRHKGRVYKPVVFDSDALHQFMTGEDHRQYLSFIDSETKSRYSDAYVIYTDDSEKYVLNCQLKISGEWTTVLFVEESYMNTFMQLKKGNTDYFAIKSFGKSWSFTPEEYEKFDDGETLVSPEGEFGFAYDFSGYPVYAVDPQSDLMYAVGEILYYSSGWDFYFLSYGEYDESYFTGYQGRFDLSNYNEVRLYKIEDEDFTEQLYNIVSFVPDDDLGWLAGEKVSPTTTAVVGGIFFIGLPLAVCAFCVVMLIKSKKKMYRFPLIALLSAAAIAAFTSLGIMLWIIP
ncbi:MAG: hypothetical protein IKU25_01760 [Clostridia bacterium]|nr:hypothetical protein [Clostridia bacterium]